MVERNLAKVEVESSSLFSRSSLLKKKKGKLRLPFFVSNYDHLRQIDISGVHGAIANRLCNGLQIRLARFDSGSRLHKFRPCTNARPLFFGVLGDVAKQ